VARARESRGEDATVHDLPKKKTAAKKATPTRTAQKKQPAKKAAKKTTARKPRRSA
jgi:DNA end-binding protein Ku